MKDILAEQLLAKIMNWEPEILAEERFQIQLFAEIKYDNYQKYSQGMKYVESLALWLQCFEASDRKVLYDFIKQNLIYISEKQMRTLVEMSYPFYIAEIIHKKAISICYEKHISDVEKRKQIHETLIKKSLFLGLSDGSHIDLFRRANPALSNEQINVYYDVSKDKFSDMISEMPDSNEIGKGMSHIFLLDDFSGSGISFIRKEGIKWKGKVAKLFDRLIKYDVQISKIDVSLILYVSTKEAVEYIRAQLAIYKKENNITANYNVEAIQFINKARFSSDIIDLLKKYYEKYEMHTIEDIHYKKGDCNSPYLGFNAGALPLVLFHNTPNNAVPIIWFSNRNEYYGLFPRVTRHKEG